MGHCVHFLSRLERVSMEHADYALELYRNPQFVRMLMEEFSSVSDDQRAALALGENGAGPYVVVAVDGGFVTCLGKHMKPRGLQVVNREFLEARRVHLEAFSAASERCYQMAEEGGLEQLLARLYKDGELISREDVGQILAILPVFQDEFSDYIVSASKYFHRNRATMHHTVATSWKLSRRSSKMGRGRANLTGAYWAEVWRIATSYVLVAGGGENSLKSLFDLEDSLLGLAHSVAFLEGHAGLVMRSLWGSGVRGPAVVTYYETVLRDLDRLDVVLGNVASLTIAALRHENLRGRVEEHLEEIREKYRKYTQVLFAVEAARKVLDPALATDDLHEDQLTIGRHVYREIRRSLLPSHPDYYEDEQEVPERLLCTLSVMYSGHVLTDERSIAVMFSCLPWLAKAEIEDLFLERRLCKRLRAAGPSAAVKGASLFAMQASAEESARPCVVEKPAGRNDPCPCNSGRKYKQCCLNGAQNASVAASALGLF